MKRKYKFLGLNIIFALVATINTTYTYANQNLDIKGESVILIEEKSGKVLYTKDENKKMFPASTTKVLTAILAMEYLDMKEIYVIGEEIKDIPWDSSKAGHVVGESIIGENLIRGLIIPSGNETACVVALQVARKSTKNNDLKYEEAKVVFTNLMNEKAKSLGANNSNFVNPHGYHDDNHYTTAFDMSLISKEAMKNETIRKIAKEKSFQGNGAGENPNPDWITKEYKWDSHNLLINSKEYAYQYATGIKTGFTKEAGYSLASSATKEDENLISVIFFSEEPNRWEDAKNLFNYGFDTFSYEHLQDKGKVISVITANNSTLGQSNEVEILAQTDFIEFLSKEELASITSEVTYANDRLFVPKDGATDVKIVQAPVVENEVLGTIKYNLDGKEIFIGNLIASKSLDKRTLKSDASFYFNVFKENVFTLKALPFWGIVIVIIIILVFVTRKRKSSWLH